MGYQEIISVLTILLLSSATVERFLELLKHVFETFGFFAGSKPDETAASEKKSKAPLPLTTNSGENTRVELDSAEGDPATLILTEAGDVKDRQATKKKFYMHIGGCLVGTFLCMKGDLGLFMMLKAPLGNSIMAAISDKIFTGILVGSGTAPIHALIRFLQAKRELSKTRKYQIPALPPPKVVTAEPTAPKGRSIINIDYFGGLNPQKHSKRLRRGNPDMIIYHHTGMNSCMGFLDVVKVFEARGFQTGYNAVITADGKCHNYCRWDARGIHTKGYNDRALGLAFSGCFESNPNVPGNNHDGEMGNLTPTDEQITAGAKVAALWALLYQIDVIQPNRLVPHKTIAQPDNPTACPGNEFPYARFEMLVNQFIQDWKSSSMVASELADFSTKSYLFVPGQA